MFSYVRDIMNSWRQRDRWEVTCKQKLESITSGKSERMYQY